MKPSPDSFLIHHHHLHHIKTMASTNPVVFFDITLAGEPLGRVKMELFADVTPRTAESVNPTLHINLYYPCLSLK